MEKREETGEEGERKVERTTVEKAEEEEVEKWVGVAMKLL